jgi:ADP-ribosylglycohydrolase
MATTDPSLTAGPPSDSPVVRSALWAACGDALGFPAELADEQMLQRRLDGAFDGSLRAWRRRIGGRMGPTVELPPGCTSDDTQLRLAVGRCVRASGRFDAEAFSKIELPVFLSYQLGAGRGTKAAAQALGRRATRWFANFYEARGSRYVDGGGNGAAMRIQPHVWAAAEGRPEDYLAPLLRDAVSTHGHPRALLGAALHAVALGTTLRQGELPRPDRWPGMLRFLERFAPLVAKDETLAERWLPVWESNAGRPFADAVADTLGELAAQVSAAVEAAEARGSRAELYADLVGRLGGLSAKTRGSGTTTAVLSLWIAWAYRDEPFPGLRVCAGLLGSDTDTIATLAGALLGAIAREDPPGPVLDAELIAAEARRLQALGQGSARESFPHPDPLRWHPPESLSDAVGLVDGRIAIAGLGFASESGDVIRGQGKDPGLWQWVITDYGQHVLIKRRAELRELPEGARPRARTPVQAEIPPPSEESRPFISHAGPDQRLPRDPEVGVALLVARDFDHVLMSRLLEHYGEQGSMPAAVFAALLSERLRERNARDRSGNGGAVQSNDEPPRKPGS